jgi:SPP1 family predicted phage head-tail adaptor
MKPRPRIGDMRERITLRGRQLVDDGFGQVETFVDVATIWARVEPVKASEQVIGGGVQSINDVLVHIRHRDDIEPTWRIVWKGNEYGISGLRNLDERGQFLTIDATGT